MKNTNLEVSRIRERCKDNEQFFASFIDSVPPRIYLNEDDRQNWFNMISNTNSKHRSNTNNNNTNPEAAVNGNDGGNDKDDDETDTKKRRNFADEAEHGHFKYNKFEPKYFKTVSQILRDFSELNRSKNKNAMNQLKQNASKMKQNRQQQAALPKSTSLKVLNKNESSKSGKNKGDPEAEAAKKPIENGKKPQQTAKRVSKFKEEKRVQVKRQRYDSQSELQIVTINHAVNGAAVNGKAANKPILNKNGQVVFSKFDFTADKSTAKSASHGKKTGKELAASSAKPKDYKKLLKHLQEKREKIEELKQTEPERAKEIETKNKWLSAIDRAQGIKPKDDVAMLKKSIKRLDKKKEKARKGWDERKKELDEKMSKQQEKRTKNLDKKKEKSKERKIKRLKKKGRVLPGF
jgi:hypothetical protein